MKLRSEIIVLVAVMGVFTIFLIQIMTAYFFASAYSEFDNKELKRTMDRIVINIEQEIEGLNYSVQDYGIWNDTRDFVEGLQPDYPSINLPNNFFAIQRVNLISIYNMSNDLVFQKGYDYENGQPLNVSTETSQDIVNFLSLNSTEISYGGIIETMNQSMMIAACGIVDSEGEGPIFGKIVFCRFIDDAEIAWLSKTENELFSFLPFSSLHDTQGLNGQQMAELNATGYLPVVLNGTTMVGFQQLEGEWIDPPFTIVFTKTRTYFVEGQQNANMLSAADAIFMAFYSVVALVVVDRVFLRRFWNLRDGVHTISESKDFSKRIQMKKVCEEINVMTKDINEMLDALEKSMEERLQSLNALDDSKRKYEEVINNQGEGVAIIDSGGKFAFVNPAAEDIFGVQRSSLTGQNLFDFVDEGGISSIKMQIRNTEQGKKDTNRLRIRRPSGELRTILITGTPRYDLNGDFAGTYGVFRDVTDMEKLESEILRTQKLESLGLVAGGIAHDFNNILSSIVSNIEMVKIRNQEDEVSCWRLREVEKAALNAHRLAEQLITFSKGGKPIKEPVDVLDVVSNSTSFALAGSNITPNLSYEPGSFTIMADASQLEQVFNNIVINAKQAMPNGGRLDVILKNIEITMKSRVPVKDGRYVSIEFIDEGAGIQEELLTNIFDPFFTTKKDGRGLGLTTALSIIRNHDGHIQVNSRIGKGTSMQIFLPAFEGDVRQSPQIALPIPEKGSGKILIMDDEEQIVEILSMLLEQMGYAVTSSRNGEEAIAAYKNAIETDKPFQGAIMDLTIRGGMGGKQAINELLAIDPKIKAIASSGYSNDPIMANPAEYGFKGVLQKPYTYDELRSTLYAVIGST